MVEPCAAGSSSDGITLPREVAKRERVVVVVNRDSLRKSQYAITQDT